MHVAIIADDLTGAADSAMEFTAPGRTVHIALAAPFDGGADVLAVDADSRECASGVAARRVAATVRALSPEAPGLWYKKLDSTLRGNVAVELMAFAAMTGCSLLLVAPAFPAQGRGFIDGALRSDGEPADRRPTALHLPSVLAGAGRTVETVALAELRDGLATVRARLRAMPSGGIVVADAMTDRDLDRIVAAAAALGRSVAYAGSAGLATALGRVHCASIPDAPTVDGPARVLLIAGSLHPTTRRQLAFAAEQVGPPLVWPHDTTARATPPTDADIAAALACHGVLTLATPDTVAANPQDLAAGFATIAARLIVDYGLRRVFCTGGEVARAVSDRLGIGRFSVEGRVQEGMPALRAFDGVPGLVMVTKAGGFGGEDGLLRAYDYLAGTDPAR